MNWKTKKTKQKTQRLTESVVQPGSENWQETREFQRAKQLEPHHRSQSQNNQVHMALLLRGK